MFDYQRFQNDIEVTLENTLRKWAEECDDIYILSLDCSRDMCSIGIAANTKQYLDEQADDDPEDYWYYKYCEEEWILYDTDDFEQKISIYMRKYVEENDVRFTNTETYEYLVAFDEHSDKMIEACKKALESFKQAINQDFPNLLLTLNIREYLDNDERIEIFSALNSKEASKEYAKHIDDFN